MKRENRSREKMSETKTCSFKRSTKDNKLPPRVINKQQRGYKLLVSDMNIGLLQYVLQEIRE